MKRILLVLLACLLSFPAVAQEEGEATPTFITTVHQCDMAGLEALVERDRERALPIMQALVDDGTIMSAGEAVHQWGDEYNLLTWVSGSDLPSTLEGWEAMGERYNEAHPEDNLFIETCPKHRDYFYTRRAWSSMDSPPVIDPEDPPTLAISYFSCDFPALGDLVEEYREKSMPIAQALVEEGMLGSEGVYTHDWGDEWNLVVTRTAPNLPALLSALEAFGERYEAEHGSESRDMLDEHCSAHKDNIYWMVMAAN